MKTILLASNNSGKIAEFEALFMPLGIRLITLKEAGIESDPEETGTTFIENALIKAKNGALLSGLPTLADDSGLVVPALKGAPGIYSARYSGTGDSAKNNAYLLQKMKNLSAEARHAYFKAVLVLIRNAEDPVPLIAEGEVHGTILTSPQGEGGFGYDPIFLYPPKACSFAELELSYKNRISHRARAAEALLQRLKAAPSSLFKTG